MRGSSYSLVTVATRLGWIAAIEKDGKLRQLTFGHATCGAAVAALNPADVEQARVVEANSPLAARLQAYATGNRDDFADIHCEVATPSEFARRVIAACRAIPFGQTCTYRELACRAGSPRAARAVGQVMAHNRIPLVIPCHRVVDSQGRYGGFSAPGGVEMKLRLLALEGTTPSKTVPQQETGPRKKSTTKSKSANIKSRSRQRVATLQS